LLNASPRRNWRFPYMKQVCYLFVIFGKCVRSFEIPHYYPATYLVLANSVTLFLPSGLSVSGMSWNRLVALKFHREPQEPGITSYLLHARNPLSIHLVNTQSNIKILQFNPINYRLFIQGWWTKQKNSETAN